MELLFELFNDYTLRNVTLGALILGLGSGALGSFTLLRKQSLLGDAVSHAALPGIVLAFLLSGSKAPLVLLLGAGAAGWLGSLLILSIIRNSRIDTDGAQGIVLSVFFGLGLMLLTYVQKMPNSSQAGLDKFLFGQAATLLESDVLLMVIVESIALTIVLLFWKEFKLMTFDPGFGSSLGFSRRFADLTLTGLIVAAIVIGLSTVGVILMSAMLVAPAAAARQWTDKLGPMVLLSALFGAVAGVSGSLLSATIEHLPTGPVIVLILTGLTVVSLLLSPRRGLVSRFLSAYHNRLFYAQDRMLGELYLLAEAHGHLMHAHEIKTLETMGSDAGQVRNALDALSFRGLVTKDKNAWALTEEGLRYASKLLHKDSENAEPPLGTELQKGTRRPS